MNPKTKTKNGRRFLLAALTPAMCLLAATGARADYFSTITNDNPVAYYQLSDPSGATSVVDSSTNSSPGFVFYVTQIDNVTVYPQLGLPGVDSNSVLFATSTGAGQGHIDILQNSTINPTPDGTNGGPFSAEAWVQATTDPTTTLEVPLDDSSDFGQAPPFDHSAGWNFYQTQGPGSTWSYSIRPQGYPGTGTTVVVGQWAHLVLTYDGTYATFYVNGVQSRKDAVPPGGFLVNNGAEDFILGEGPATGWSAYDGYISQVALYNYPLSAAQVMNHYTVGTNEIAAPPTAPSFATQPASAVTTYAGVPVTFSSQALGTAPLSYHWQRQGSGPIPNATNNTYTITPSFPADNNAVFFVTVTNIVGSTNSTTATLTVQTNLNINNSPFSITRRVGSHAAFRVAANGAVPITYLWHVVSNAVDTAITGATTDTLWLTNVQAGQSGNSYYAQVTGPFGASPSGQASLTVVARTNTATTNAYFTVVMADNPVAFWRLDESTGATNAIDVAGSFDGSYQAPSGILTFGYPSGVPHDTSTAIHVTNSAIVSVPYALELNPVTGPWSYEFWIQPTSLSGNFPTPISAEGNQNLGQNLSGWNIYQHSANVWTWNIYNGGPNGSFTSEFTDNPIVPGTWYHMVLTDDGTNMNWYSNDRFVFSTTTAAVGFVPNGINGDPSVAGGPTTLAVRSDNVFGDWDGGIQDVAVYNYVLSPAQIQNHFLNSTHVSITQSGGKYVVSWSAGTLQSASVVTGPYTTVVGATSPYTNTLTGTQKYFRAQLQ